jgi:hypothetical protein
MLTTEAMIAEGRRVPETEGAGNHRGMGGMGM